MNERRKELLQELRDPQYREAYAEGHMNSLLATQISTIREQRGFTQAQLAEAIQKQQPAISRIENVRYARWNIETLRSVARALGCWLNVRFESWGFLVEDADTYTLESLRRNLIGDDPAFFGSEAVGFIPEPVRWMQARVLPWLDHGATTGELRRWLAGTDLPPLGDAEPPYVWISRSVEVEPPHSRFRTLLVERVLELWSELERETESAADLYNGVFNILATFPTREASAKIHEIYALKVEGLNKLPVDSHPAFLTALIRNQFDRRLENEWLEAIKARKHPWLPANQFDAFEGLKRMTLTPRIDAIAKGLQAMYNDQYTYSECEQLMIELMQGVKLSFGDQAFLGELLYDWGSDSEWHQPIWAAFAKVFGSNQEDRRALIDGAPQLKKPPIRNILHQFATDTVAAAA